MKERKITCKKCHRTIAKEEYTYSLVKGSCAWSDFIVDKEEPTNKALYMKRHTGYHNMRKAYEGFMDKKINKPLEALEVTIDAFGYYVWRNDMKVFFDERNGKLSKYIAIDKERNMLWGPGGWRREPIPKVFCFYGKPKPIANVKWKKVKMCHSCSEHLIDESAEEHKKICKGPKP